MDPARCLQDASSALDAGDINTAVDRLDAYARWRDHGGFEPVGGDTLHEALADILTMLLHETAEAA